MQPYQSRREMLQRAGLGFGSLALAQLFQQDLVGGGDNVQDLKQRQPHFEPRVKSVILMMQNGGPSQMVLFDPKPELVKRDGQKHTGAIEQFQPGSEGNKLLKMPFPFTKHGTSGMDFASVVPHIASVADEICKIRSMVSGHNNHTEALIMFNTGKLFPGRPALGSWVSYGLGTANQNLPAYIVLRDERAYNTSGTMLWSNGWMSAIYGGTEVATKGTPVLNLAASDTRPEGVDQENLALLGKINRRFQARFKTESDLEARIQNYELAARMQLAAPEILDLSKESGETKKMYGVDQGHDEMSRYGTRCLMARRLVESGVRFIQVFPPGSPNTQPWDAHGNVKTQNEAICKIVDQPTAGLITDLKQRGLLASTLIVWSGEFGRLPISQNGSGRDHNRNACTTLLAGGGVKGGLSYGNTDPLGYRSVEDVVTVHDLHATVLHQMGLSHKKLVYRHHGHDESLTDSRVTDARVVGDILQNDVQPL